MPETVEGVKWVAEGLTFANNALHVGVKVQREVCELVGHASMYE